MKCQGGTVVGTLTHLVLVGQECEQRESDCHAVVQAVGDIVLPEGDAHPEDRHKIRE